MLSEELIINTLRMLSIDQIEGANSGHPGLPMGAAPVAYTLWSKHMKFNPKKPDWFDRDRFVLSAGHGSALLYALLHLFGYDLSLDDLKAFRQWGSKTPGHPEFGHTPGVEATTGPLGQGVANGVGMALAEAHLAARYNKPGYNIIDHYTYVLCSDGDLMEGVASEAISLAGHLGLGKLIMLYDSNHISLDGDLEKAFSENIEQRFHSYGWHVLNVPDANDIAAIDQAIAAAKLITDRPTLIEINSVIGYGSPNRAGSSEAHGKPLGTSELQEVHKAYSWTGPSDFHVPKGVREAVESMIVPAIKQEGDWQELLENYKQAFPELSQELLELISGSVPELDLPEYDLDSKPVATRVVSGEVLQSISEQYAGLVGGSADLASSNNTLLKKQSDLSRSNYAGRNIWFGVREHGMAAIANGMLLHGALRPYVATFLVFSDYLRPAVRLAALSKLPVIYVFTHDSIAVGEDGPTHQPVEHVAALRLIPNLYTVRPADANETLAAWQFALKQTGTPVALILTRQNLPVLEGSTESGLERGGYIISEPKVESPDGIFIATGSEVHLAIQAQQVLAKEGIYWRVVSMPCRELFEEQNVSYRQEVIPRDVPCVVIEAGHPSGWEAYSDSIICVNRFGASAPGDQVMREYGFNLENLVREAKQVALEFKI